MAPTKPKQHCLLQRGKTTAHAVSPNQPPYASKHSSLRITLFSYRIHSFEITIKAGPVPSTKAQTKQIRKRYHTSVSSKTPLALSNCGKSNRYNLTTCSQAIRPTPRQSPRSLGDSKTYRARAMTSAPHRPDALVSSPATTP